MSSTAWERCPNCSRNTKQDPITASEETKYRIPLFAKPELELFIERLCHHCGTEYRANFHLTLKNREITKKGKEGWK